MCRFPQGFLTLMSQSYILTYKSVFCNLIIILFSSIGNNKIFKALYGISNSKQNLKSQSMIIDVK